MWMAWLRAVLLCRSTEAALIALFGADRVALQPGREDVDRRRGVRMSLLGSILARMTRFDDQDLSDSEFRECDLTRARLIGVVMQDAVIDGLVTNLMVNGVEVSSYVEAELDRRHPVRLLIRSADPAELLRGLRELQAAWAATLVRLRRMPRGSEHRRVGGEWSAAETLRHLVFVHDCWFGRCCLGLTRPPTAFGVVPGYVLEHEPGLDRAATPSLDQVLAVRDRQLAELGRWLSAVTADELLMPAPVPEGPGWPPYARGKSVLECVHVVLDEEWAHHGFCERDIALLGGGSSPLGRKDRSRLPSAGPANRTKVWPPPAFQRPLTSAAPERRIGHTPQGPSGGRGPSGRFAAQPSAWCAIR